jgi:hypothetical protein
MEGKNMTGITGKKAESVDYTKKTLALAAIASALAIAFMAAAFFYPPSRAHAASPVGYENALSAGRLDDTDVTSSDELPTMMSIRTSD